MPYRLAQDHARQLVLIWVDGVLTLDVSLSVLRDVNDPNKVDRRYHHLVDLSDVHELDMNVADIMALADAHKPLDQQTERVAFVIGEEHKGRFYLAKFFEVVVAPFGPKDLKVFLLRSDAESWLFKAS